MRVQLVQARDLHDEPLVCRVVADFPQHLPRLLREEVSIGHRLPREIPVAPNPWDPTELELFDQCSGAHLRRTGTSDL